MLIAVPHGSVRAGLWKETGALWNMWRQGRRQNIPFRFILSPAAIRAIAPVRALGGIFIPSVCVIDLEAFVKALVEDAKTGDAQFFFGHEVIGIAFEENNHILQTTAGEVKGRILVNSAGLTAHRVAEMAGCPTYKVEFVRGDYYELIGGIARWNIHTLVYPAMPPHARSKGMHFGPRTDGRLYVGPSATLMPQEAPKELFVEAARKFLPDVKEGDLQWAYAGVRPKLLVSNGKPDFTIRMDSLVPPVINLVGIDSPGLSASMAIARYVAKIVLNAR
jgi:L-2-hydroxyglutarate oxidase LhgO